MPSPSLDAWHSSLGGRVHLSPCVSLHLSPVVSPPGCLAQLSGWTRSFVSLGSLVSLCLPSFVSAWMIQSGWTGSFVSLCHLSPVVSQPGCLGVDGFMCLPLSPFICLPAWMPGAARVHCLPSFVSLHLSPVVSQPGSDTALWVDGFMCLSLSPSFVSRSLPAWMPGTALWVDGFICLPLSPLISPVVSQPGCLARLSGWAGSFVSLCLPLSPRMSGTPLFPFICLPLSPSLDA